MASPFSISAFYIRSKHNNIDLSIATGFLYQHEERCFIVSNWHVLSGRNPNSGQPINTDGGIPNKIIATLPSLNQDTVTWRSIEFQLTNNEGENLWIQHETHGQRVDIALLEVQIENIYSDNALNLRELNQQIVMRITDDVFVLGYPSGITGGAKFPIWKRASIASEPDLDIGGLPTLLIDTATRSGMSGSPVLLRTNGIYQIEGGGGRGMMSTGEPLHRFVGIYSGRIPNDNEDPQLGIVWKSSLIDEIIAAPQPGGYIIA